ncbi:MAG TPA: glycosyltransferase [Gaiellaceae bacterium]|nr:glycosyltransferase [Gaiellaceae bacterium]
MIFVVLGTQRYPFDRLLRALDGIDEELVVQGGPSTYRPPGAAWFPFLDYPALVERIRAARVVVAHAGVGVVVTAVANGKRPLVVPRLKRFGEAVDDHQAPFARRLAEAGLAIVVEDVAELPAAVAETPSPPASLAGESRLAADLREYLLEVTEVA